MAAHGSQAGLSDGRTRDLVLAVHELAANAVRHGAGQGRLRLWATPDGVRCEVTDDGARMAPATEAAEAARCGTSSPATGCGWSGGSPTGPASSRTRPAPSPR